MSSNMVVNYPKLSHEQVLALEPHYSRHVAAMTEEGLYGKAEIAEQLALRDAKITELNAKLEQSFDAVFACSYSGALQSFRDLFEAREHFTSALMRQGGAGLGPLSDAVQEKADAAFRALKAADKAFKEAPKSDEPTLADYKEDIALVERAMANETPPLVELRRLLGKAQREVAALTFSLGRVMARVGFAHPSTVPSGLAELLKEARARVDAMSPEERETMYRQQRESWAQGQMGLIDSDRAYSKSRGIDGD